MTATGTAPAEPGWVRHAIWWRVYPLGAVGAFPEPAAGPATADEHRLLRLVGWLDHVVALGASGIALGPVFASSTHGYDTLDHDHVDPRLGTDDDLDALILQAHERGLRVQLDGVFNHVGREHPWARAALAAGPGSEAARVLRQEPGPDGAPRFVAFEGHEALLELDHDEPAVRDLVVDVMRRWLDRGVDAWRLDAAYRVPTSFWADVLPRVRETHPEVWFEAEVIHGDYAAFVAASTADTVTQYELWKAAWSSLNDGNPHELAWTLGRHDALLETFAPSTFVGNHDVTRLASRLEDARHLAHAVVLLATVGGTPTVYAGDELGLRGVKEERFGGDDAIRPELPGSAAELLAQADGVAGGAPSVPSGTASRTLELHQRLLALRRRHPWLHRARSTVREVTHEVLVYDVVAPEGDPDAAPGARLTVALNMSESPHPLPDQPLLTADDATRPGTLAPHGWAVLGAGPLG